MEPFPDQRKAADAIKEAGHSGLCGGADAQAGQYIRPGREGNAVAQRFVAGAVSVTLVQLALAVSPVTYVGPLVWKALEPFTLQGSEAADIVLLSDTWRAVEALAASRFCLQSVENIWALHTVAAVDSHHKVSGIFVISTFQGR